MTSQLPLSQNPSSATKTRYGHKFPQARCYRFCAKTQKHYFGRSVSLPGAPEQDALAGEEISFIQARDSFYIATSQSGALQARIAELEARLKACKV